MKKHRSKRGWLKEHFNDPYVKQAHQQGFRSRAVFKLQEINERDHLFRPGQTVLDLGAAPGSWSQVAVRAVGHSGRIIASDILEMTPLPGVEFLQGDFREDAVYEQLLNAIGDAGVDLVISDMAPNISGMDAVDQPRSMVLVELAVEMARKVLKKKGDLLIKVFQGGGFDQLVKDLRKEFDKVLIRKPKASRSRSREVYVLARGFRQKATF